MHGGRGVALGVGGRRVVGEKEGKKDEEDGERSSWRASERRARRCGPLIGCTRDGGPSVLPTSKATSGHHHTTTLHTASMAPVVLGICPPCPLLSFCFVLSGLVLSGFHLVSGRVSCSRRRLLVELGCVVVDREPAHLPLNKYSPALRLAPYYTIMACPGKNRRLRPQSDARPSPLVSVIIHTPAQFAYSPL